MTEAQLAELIARHIIAILLVVTGAMLVLGAVFWRLLAKYAPAAWRIGLRVWNALIATAVAQRVMRVSWVSSGVRRTSSAVRFVGLYALASLLTAAAATAALIEVVDAIGVGDSLREFDMALSGALREELPHATLRVFAWITVLGNPDVLTGLVVLVAIVLLWRRRWWLAGAWIAATASGALLNRLLKVIFHRQRPLHDHGFASETTWSFPSGHAAGSMLVYALLGYLIVRHTPRAWHLPMALSTATLIVFVGSSRVLLQVHYFSDVLAGYAFASAWAALWIAGMESVRSARRRRGSSASAEIPPQ